MIITSNKLLESGDKVRFWLAYSIYSIFQIMWIELEVTGAMLRDREERTNLAGWLENVSPGTELKSVMTDNTSHLVMSNISLSMKVCLKE